MKPGPDSAQHIRRFVGRFQALGGGAVHEAEFTVDRSVADEIGLYRPLRYLCEKTCRNIYPPVPDDPHRRRGIPFRTLALFEITDDPKNRRAIRFAVPLADGPSYIVEDPTRTPFTEMWP